MFRRLLAITALLAGSALAAAPHVAVACDQNSCTPPQVAGVSPQQITLDGKPIRITISGYGMSGATQVLTAPVLPLQGFQVFNDTTLLVTLPASTEPGVYSVRVVTPAGASDPTYSPQFQVFAAPPPSQAPTPAPKPTPTPQPTPVPTAPQPETGVVALAPVGSHHDTTPRPPAVLAGGVSTQVSPASAPIDIMAGLALGAMIYVLWGSPRRLSGSWREAPLVHLVGRPMQAMRAGKVCLYCGRLHFIWNTRRDIWSAGRYCGPKCFISAEAMPSPLVEEDEPEPVAEHKKAAWWRAAVATADGGSAVLDEDVDVAVEEHGSAGWRPRF